MIRRNDCRLVLLMLLTVCICGCTRFASEPDRLLLNHPPKKRIWVSGPELVRTLRVDDEHRIEVSDLKGAFTTDLPVGLVIHSLASYEDPYSLTVVSADARVFHLEHGEKGYATAGFFRTDKPATVLQVRFSFVPGLVYLLCDDDQLKVEITDTEQRYPDFDIRVALGKGTNVLHGVPWEDPAEAPLTGVYRTEEDTLHLTRRSGAHLALILPEPLVEPQRDGPMDDLAQAVFVFPNNWIVCHVEHGWAVFSLGGRLLGHFQFEGPSPGWWMDPVIRDGQLFVSQRTGPSGNTYRLDLTNGTIFKQVP